MSKKTKLYARFFAFIAGLVVLAISTAALFHFIERKKSVSGAAEPPSMNRAPSSVIYNDEGEPVFWEQSLEEVERIAKNDSGFRGSVSEKTGAIFSRPGSDGFVTAEEASRRTGIKAVRARVSPFNVRSFARLALQLETHSQQRVMRVDLFEDTRLILRLERPALHETNRGVYWGQVEGDPTSRVQLFVGEGKMNATIETKGRVYRVVDAGEDTDHFIIEERRDPKQ